MPHHEYIPLNNWQAPLRIEPSDNYHGEDSTNVIHEAVGRSLSTWEHAESANIKLFQLLCESKILTACRVYGTLDSVFSRHNALKYAAEEFFFRRDQEDLAKLKTLINAYSKTGQYRNYIAHGMAIQPHAFGYFLCPPSYATRRRETPRPDERWALGADYFYRVSEIDYITTRFQEILESTMSLVLYLNNKYEVLNGSEFHP